MLLSMLVLYEIQNYVFQPYIYYYITILMMDLYLDMTQLLLLF